MRRPLRQWTTNGARDPHAGRDAPADTRWGCRRRASARSNHSCSPLPDVPERLLAPRCALRRRAMFKRAVRAAVRRGSITDESLAQATDDGLMELLITRDGNQLAAAIRSRGLYKRALDLPASDVSDAASRGSRRSGVLERLKDGMAARGRAGAQRAAARFSRALVDARHRPAPPHPQRGGGAAATPAAPDNSGCPHGRRAVPERAPPPGIRRGDPTQTAPQVQLLTCPADEVRRHIDRGRPCSRRRRRSIDVAGARRPNRGVRTRLARRVAGPGPTCRACRHGHRGLRGSRPATAAASRVDQHPRRRFRGHGPRRGGHERGQGGSGCCRTAGPVHAHTTMLDRLAVEGRVPAADLRRLLR